MHLQRRHSCAARGRLGGVTSAGFTLIEVMVATAFFLIVISAILNVQVKSTGMLRKSRNFERAANLLNDMGELLQAVPSSYVLEVANAQDGTPYADDGLPVGDRPLPIFYRFYVDIVPSEATLKRLNLRVDWPEDHGNRTVTSSVIVNLP